MRIRGGYAGRILYVDLTRREVTKEPIEEDVCAKLIGGRGFSSYMLYKEVGAGCEPFDPSNLVVFASGPLNGTPVPSSGRLTVAARSPMTGGLGDANSGGSFAPEMKWAGYDAIAFRGRADFPVYLLVVDDRVEVRDARHLWGKDTEETTQAIRDELRDPDVHVACIGPGGENLVRYACVIVDGSGASGRCGIGAVMGSKNLKAVAVRGTRGVEIADPDGLRSAIDAYLTDVKEDGWAKNLTRYGTINLVVHRQTLGLWGAYNFQRGVLDGCERLDPEVFRSKYLMRILGCMGCAVRCRRFSKVESGPYAPCYTKGPEYDTVNALAAKTGVTDPEAVIYAHRLTDLLGIDAQSAGSSIAMAMELFEKGLINEEDTGGLRLRFGDAASMIRLLGDIAHRRGFGDVLAEGCKVMGERLGRGASYYAAHIKGLEIDATDPRPFLTRAVTYAVSTRGSCHLRGFPYIDEFITPEEALHWFGTEKVADLKSMEGKGRMIAWSENWVSLADMFGLCKFAWYRSRKFKSLIHRGVELAGAAFRAATGLDVGDDELLKAGERLINVEKLFNLRFGLGRADDYPPERFFKEPVSGGPQEGSVLDRAVYDRVLDDYYAARGWDGQGRPTPEKLRELGIDV